jgi:hypothetical protein
MTRIPSAVAAGIVLLAAPLARGAPGTPPLSASRVPATYAVELWTTGPFSEAGCSSGDDRLVGQLTGDEPATTTENVVYRGTLKRTTGVNFCHHRRLPNDEDVACSISIAGSGSFDVELTVYPEDRRGGYLEVTDAAIDSSRVSGTCDAVEMADLQNDYSTGDTAGSPNGQPIEDNYSRNSPFFANDIISLPIGVYPPMPNSRGWTFQVHTKLCC